jgi:hypothetical protein
MPAAGREKHWCLQLETYAPTETAIELVDDY